MTVLGVSWIRTVGGRVTASGLAGEVPNVELPALDQDLNFDCIWVMSFAVQASRLRRTVAARAPVPTSHPASVINDRMWSPISSGEGRAYSA